MKITEIKIRKFIDHEENNRLRGIISITIDNFLAVHDIKVVQGEQRIFVAMPSRRDENGVYRDIVHPISAEARKEMEEQILEEYTRERDRRDAEIENNEYNRQNG